jgi:predicted ribosomally synthesized peptide with SipW-like signal peptide
MRRILFPLLVIGLAAGLFTLGSGAFFSDTETDTGNTIVAGTLDLGLGGAIGACDTDQVIPGQLLPACNITLNMAGSLNDLYLYAQTNFGVSACNPAGANDSTEFCDTTADLGPSDFAVEACSFDGGSCPWAFTSGETTLADLFDCVPLDQDADAGEDNRTLSIQVRANTSIGNAAQGDRVDFAFTFGLSQPEDSPSSRCLVDGGVQAAS